MKPSPIPFPSLLAILKSAPGRFHSHPDRLTIRGKFIFVVLLSTLSALAISFGLNSLITLVTFHQTNLRQLRVTGEITSMNVSPSLVFNDAESAERALRPLGQDPRIVSARVFLPDGRVFACFNAKDPASVVFPKKPPVARTTWRYLESFVPILADQETIGWLFLRRDYQDYQVRVFYLLASALIAAFAGIGIAFLVSSRLQSLITRPILELSSVAHRVSETKDYSLRAATVSSDETGDLTRVFNEMMDLIQRRDRELLQARDILEEAVQDRTRKLQQEIEEKTEIEKKIKKLLWQIQEDNEKLYRLDQMKTDFIANVSHELRTPLTSILGFMKLLLGQRMGPLTETQQDFVKTTLANADRLLALVNDLLDMSKLEAGSIRLEYGEQDPDRLLSTVAGSLRSLAENKGIRLVVHPSPGRIPLQADGEMIQRVLINLLSNAIKFTPSGGSIEMEAQPGERHGIPGVVFTVKDTGIGIPPEDLSRVFDKFFQVSSHLTRKTGGTGLGLAISRNIVHAHQGEIWVESQLNRGATFYCFLPSRPSSA